jgi:hypothetical protein
MSGAIDLWHAIATRLTRLRALAGRRSDRLANVAIQVASSASLERPGTLSLEVEDRERQLEDRELELRMLMAHWM